MRKVLDRWNLNVYRRKKRIIFLAVAVVLGAVCTLITYPGIFYSDSYGRWRMAYELARFNFPLLDDWLSAPPQLFMALLYRLTQSYGSFTLVQAVAFFFTAFCAIDVFCPNGGLGAGVLFAACPIFWGFSVYVEMSVVCVTALLWLLMLLLDTDYSRWAERSKVNKVLYGLLCFFVLLQTAKTDRWRLTSVENEAIIKKLFQRQQERTMRLTGQ